MSVATRGARLLVASQYPGDAHHGGDATRPLPRIERRDFTAPRFVDDADDTRLDRLVAVGSVDVRVHLERVNREIARGDAEGTYGALVDLFIALGPNVAEVRNRALYWARDVLARHHYEALAARVEHGLEATTPMPPTLRSVCSRGVTGSTVLVGDGTTAPAPARRSAAARPAPRRSLFDDPAPAAATDPRTTFEVGRTVAGVVRAHAHPTAGFTLNGAFGTITVAARSVWVDLAPGGAAALPAVEYTAPVEVHHVDPQRVDRTGSRDLESALWDLTVAVSAGRLPADLPTDVPLRLRHWPDLTRAARVDGDLRLASILTRRPTPADALADDAATRTFLAAAWVSGLLVVADGPAGPDPQPPAEEGPGTAQAARRSVLRSLVSRLRGRHG